MAYLVDAHPTWLYSLWWHLGSQFNNVLASLLHALALSRLLCRTLLLPGFFVRFGARLTRVSNFEERWLPTFNANPNPNSKPNLKPNQP